MSSGLDLVNKVFGRLTVVSRAENSVSRLGKIRRQWNVVCECGNTRTLLGGTLTSGNTKSCGCLYNVSNKTNAKKRKLNRVAQESVLGKDTRETMHSTRKQRNIKRRLRAALGDD